MYRRVLLKLSGEMLAKEGLDRKAFTSLAALLKKVYKKIQIGIVLGGGNFIRGSNSNYSRVIADQMGMLATLVNGLALSDVLESLSVPVKVLSSIPCPYIESFSQKRALELLEAHTILLFVGGTSHPYFSTDTAAALRAIEIQADILLKATKVDGVYEKDPHLQKSKRYKKISYSELIEKNITVMDQTAFALCRENHLPLRIFHFRDLEKALIKEDIGTKVE